MRVRGHIANLNAKDIRALIVTNVGHKAHLMTDESSMYKQVGLEMRAHTAVHHGNKQYVRHQGLLHSNTAENFFSILKRGVIGTYHHMSEAHLACYTAEFDFRYDTLLMSAPGNAPTQPLLASAASASPIGGLTNSPPGLYQAPRTIGGEPQALVAMKRIKLSTSRVPICSQRDSTLCQNDSRSDG